MKPEPAEPADRGEPADSAVTRPARHPDRGALAVLAALVALQGVALLGFAAFSALALVRSQASEPRGATSVLGLSAAAGGALLLVARGLRRSRRWSRSPAVLTQLILLPVALSLVRSERWYVGAPLLGWAAATLVLLFAPDAGGRLRD